MIRRFKQVPSSGGYCLDYPVEVGAINGFPIDATFTSWI